MKNDRPGNRRAPTTALLLGLALLPASRALAQTPSPDPAIASDSAPPGSAAMAPGSPDAAPAAPGDAAPAAPVEVVNLSVQGAFTAASARVGDSLDYVLSVEWPETGLPVVVLAPDSLDFQGFQVIGQAASHKKLATSQGIGNRSEFVYRLRARTPGSGKATSLKLRYLTGLSRNEQAQFVPTAHLDIGAARTPLAQSLWFRLLAGWFALAAAGAVAWSAFKFASRRREAKRPAARRDLGPEVLALKGRLRTASLGTPGVSQSILQEMESLCIRHLRQELGIADGAAPGGAGAAGGTGAPGGAGAPPAAQAKFEPLLDRYLAANGSKPASDAASGDWAGLRDLFRHARFAGGHKEPHELQDAYRALKKCLRITEEPGEE